MRPHSLAFGRHINNVAWMNLIDVESEQHEFPNSVSVPRSISEPRDKSNCRLKVYMRNALFFYLSIIVMQFFSRERVVVKT